MPVTTTIHKPRALRPGDCIGVIAPGSPVAAEALRTGVAELERLGYRVRFREDIFAADGYLAGGHDRRATELLDLLRDPEVRALFFARGGYGSNYVLERLAGAALPEPKIVMGYSDATALLSFLWQRHGWVTFHGPMVATDFAQGPARYHLPSLTHALAGDAGEWLAGCADQVLRPGVVEGTLLGGCLSLLVATLGTPREVDWQDAVLFLEDVGEAPYRLDRMLFHLREAGKLDGVRGILFGEMKDCGSGDLRALDGLDMPIARGFPSGHTTGANGCLPFGVRARLDHGRLTILEKAVC